MQQTAEQISTSACTSVPCKASQICKMGLGRQHACHMHAAIRQTGQYSQLSTDTCKWCFRQHALHTNIYIQNFSVCDSHHLLPGLCVAVFPSVLHPFGRFGALSGLDGLGCCQAAHLHAASGVSSCSAALMRTLSLLASSTTGVASYFQSISLLY